MIHRPWILAEAHWKTLKETRYDLAVLPWGATEAHNFHLPYSTDNVQACYVADEAARRAWDQGYRTMVLPPVPFGVQSAQIDVPFNINMRPSTQFAVLRDIVDSLERQGMHKLVILNGHGGNNFVQMVRELYLETKVRIFTLNWYDVVPAKKFFEVPGDHGGEMETSVMLFIAPDMVLPLSVAGKGLARHLRVPSLREGWVWTQRGWLNEVTNDAGIGDPSAATARKGEQFLGAILEAVSRLFKEIAELNLSSPYEP